MLPETFTFNKTIEQRKVDFGELYESGILCSKASDYWAFKLELILGEAREWVALWRPNEESCIGFDILYPASIVVTVSIN